MTILAEQLLLFDLPPAPPAAKNFTEENHPSRRSSKAQPGKGIERELALDERRLLSRKLRLEKFRFGQTVSKNQKILGVICGFIEFQKLHYAWVLWSKHPWAFSPYPALPTMEELSELSVLAERPKPNLPRDVPPDDSLTVPSSMDVSESPQRQGAALGVSESSDDDLPPPPASLQTYYPAGEARGHNAYFRIAWRDPGGKPKFRHVRGGNIYKLTARERAERIRDAIARRDPLEEILRLC